MLKQLARKDAIEKLTKDIQDQEILIESYKDQIRINENKEHPSSAIQVGEVEETLEKINNVEVKYCNELKSLNETIAALKVIFLLIHIPICKTR